MLMLVSHPDETPPRSFPRYQVVNQAMLARSQFHNALYAGFPDNLQGTIVIDRFRPRYSGVSGGFRSGSVPFA